MATAPKSPREKAAAQAAELRELRQAAARPTAGPAVDIFLPLYAVATGKNAEELEDHINIIAQDGYELVPGTVAMRQGTIVAVMILNEEEPEEFAQPPQPAPQPQPAQQPAAAPTQRAVTGTGAAAAADAAPPAS